MNYAFINEPIPTTVIRQGHHWYVAPQGGTIGASRSRDDGRAEVDSYQAKHNRVPGYDGKTDIIFKAISVPTIMKKDDPNYAYRKGEKFYITYIREVRVSARKGK